LVDTHVCSRLWLSFTKLSMAFSGKADQIKWSASLNSGTVFNFSCSLWCDSSIAPRPDNPVKWRRLKRANDDWRWSHGSLTWWNAKLAIAKTINTPRKINVILLNIKVNQPNLVNVCGYKLATKWLNVTEIYLVYVKILHKVLTELLFDSHCGRPRKDNYTESNKS